MSGKSKDARIYVNPKSVLLAACRFSGVPVAAILGNGRHARVVRARRLYAAACRVCSLASYAEIGAAIDGRGHSSIRQMLRWVDRVEANPALDLDFFTDVYHVVALSKIGREEAKEGKPC